MIIVLIYSCTNIREDRGNTIGIITKKNIGYRGGYSLIYRYNVNGKNYEVDNGRFNWICDFETTFQGKRFPVVYAKKDPSCSLILITPDDYANWGYQFPDSLDWVRKCFNDSSF
jgi:hypothetical protein